MLKKRKSIEMEWAWMEDNKSNGRSFLRVLAVCKKGLLWGLFLGISFGFSVFLANQVIGSEQKTFLNLFEHKIREPIQYSKQAQEQTGTNKGDFNRDVLSERFDCRPEPELELGLKPSYQSVASFKGDRFTVLLVGIDQRPSDQSFGNTDTLLVASVNTLTGKVALLSIPRDTQVTIPGHGKEKINAAARVGKGIETTTTLIEDLIGQSIDGYMITNFDGFKSIIDTLGGITLNIEKDMYYETGDSIDGVINLRKGTQRLNGAQVLQYARFRQDALADISRTARQQAILKAIGEEFLQIKTIPKIPWLIPQISKSVETNLPITTLWSMTNYLFHIENPEISSQTLPGNFLIENNISYWKVDPVKSRVAVRKLFEEGKTSSVFFTP